MAFCSSLAPGGVVARQGRQPAVFDRSAHREVVEALGFDAFEPEHVVDWIVEKSADPRAADAGGLRLKIENLTDQPRLPVETTVKPWAEFTA